MSIEVDYRHMENRSKDKNSNKKLRKSPKTMTMPKTDWYVLMGFNKENEDDVGFLAMNDARTDYRQNAYKIVHDT